MSTPWEQIKAHYGVVVVGSGYGGSIAASRLARAGQDVCLLERGKEFVPGEFPDTPGRVAAEAQFNGDLGRIGPRTGLYDFRINPQVNVFVGCGLGGTSLINANVSEMPIDEVFADERWPHEIRSDLAQIRAHAESVRDMLGATPYPNLQPLRKLRALEESARAVGGVFSRPAINVTFEEGRNAFGIYQGECRLCGDCVTGCNHAAKNTLAMNYLPDAWRHGAQIFTEIAVDRLERRGSKWLVRYEFADPMRGRFGAPEMFVTADTVILAAGTLGSTEILLRSRGALPMSPMLGKRFSGNGDVLAFSYNGSRAVNGVGFGHRNPDDMVEQYGPVGPCITGMIDGRGDPERSKQIVLEEGSMPGALAGLLAPAFAAIAGAPNPVDPALLERQRRQMESLLRGAYYGSVRHTQTFLAMGHDEADGELHLDALGRVRVNWRNVAHQDVFRHIESATGRAAAALGGKHASNPLGSRLGDASLVTVHPLGGCAMGEHAGVGVVNHRGQVFSGQAGTAVHDGLYVCDGAVIPCALGINPLLTISALAERCCDLMAEEPGRRWRIVRTVGTDGGEPPVRRPAPSRLGIQFTERMSGFFGVGQIDYRQGAAHGRSFGTSMSFVLTIADGDLDEMLDDPEHASIAVGTVTCPALSRSPLNVNDGWFSLLARDDTAVDTRAMRYRLHLTADDGRAFYFDGFKVIHDDTSRFDLWTDTTTLYVTVYEGDSAAGRMVGRGILDISVADFATQLTTMEVTGALDDRERLEALARFGRFFAGTLFDTYGGLFARPTLLDPQAPPRKRRALRVDPPEVHMVRTSDNVSIRLTRYRGGVRGPVMLSHGLGVSSRIFSIDTIETNLLEYLCVQGYDVWLLDYRASIDLPASRGSFSGDDVARYDYPAAVAFIRSRTGASAIQVVAHCFGASTFCMAMLDGLTGVRSAVLSQIAAHVDAGSSARIKSGLHLPGVLRILGVDSLTAYTDTHGDWRERLLDDALRFYPIEPEERCRSAVCHRITFMYAPLYEHDRLNGATHAALHEMFGIANIEAFEHLALMTREGRLVGADGRDRYMPHLDRLAIPIMFVHGSENACFRPESTARTMRALVEANGAHLYARTVVPDYGHIDCIFGKDAAADVYPHILDHLEATA